MHSRPNHKKRISIAVGGAFLVLLFFFHVPLSGFMGNIAHEIFDPVVAFSSRVGDVFARAGDALPLGQGEREELTRLRNNQEEMRLHELRFATLLREYEILKELVGHAEKKERIYGRLIADNTHAPYDTILIDTKQARAQVGDLIFGPGDVLLGNVLSVRDSFVTASLLSAPGKEFSVRIGNGDITTVLSGRGGGNFKAAVPKEASVAVGDPVLISDSLFVIGVVGQVIQEEESNTSDILVRSPLNITTLTWVSLGKE